MCETVISSAAFNLPPAKCTGQFSPMVTFPFLPFEKKGTRPWWAATSLAGSIPLLLSTACTRGTSGEKVILCPGWTQMNEKEKDTIWQTPSKMTFYLGAEKAHLCNFLPQTAAKIRAEIPFCTENSKHLLVKAKHDFNSRMWRGCFPFKKYLFKWIETSV